MVMTRSSDTYTSVSIAALTLCRLKRFTYVAILILPILGAFEKFRRATFRFVMCVYPSADPSAWNNSAPAGPIFTKLDTVSLNVFLTVLHELTIQ